MIKRPAAIVAMIAAGLAAGISTAAAQQVDTLGMLTAAVEHHFPEGALDSAVLQAASPSDTESPITAAMVADLGEHFALQVAPRPEVFRCDDEPRIPRRCEIIGFERLVTLTIDELEEERAVVRVAAWHEWRDGYVDLEGAQYLLERQQGEWVVTERLMSFAS